VARGSARPIFSSTAISLRSAAFSSRPSTRSHTPDT
jgi:hypothetical protein